VRSTVLTFLAAKPLDGPSDLQRNLFLQIAGPSKSRPNQSLNHPPPMGIPALAMPGPEAPLIMVESAFAEDFRGSATKAGLEMIPTAASGDESKPTIIRMTASLPSSREAGTSATEQALMSGLSRNALRAASTPNHPTSRTSRAPGACPPSFRLLASDRVARATKIRQRNDDSRDCFTSGCIQ
jgi:hypothetical protein